MDALTQKVREGGRTVSVACLAATGVNAGGHREILGVDVTSSEDGAGNLNGKSTDSRPSACGDVDDRKGNP